MIAKRHALGVLLVAVVAMGASAPAPDPGQPWSRFGVGSWVLTEVREADGNSVLVYQVRTTVTGIEDNRIHLQDDTVGTGSSDRVVLAGAEGGANAGRDSVIGERVLVVGGKPFHCRLVRSDVVGVPLCGNDPVEYQRSTSYRWESPDFPRFGGVIRRVSTAGATYYVDGHVESHPDSMVWEVLSLHERLRVGRRNVDCCVVRRITPDVGTTNPPDTVTTWLSGEVPTMEAREISIDHASGRGMVERNAIAFEVRK